MAKAVTVSAPHSFEVWPLLRPQGRCVFLRGEGQEGVGGDRARAPCPAHGGQPLSGSATSLLTSPALEGAPAPPQWPKQWSHRREELAVSAGLLGARSGRAGVCAGQGGARRAGGGALSGGQSAG